MFPKASVSSCTVCSVQYHSPVPQIAECTFPTKLSLLPRNRQEVAGFQVKARIPRQEFSIIYSTLKLGAAPRLGGVRQKQAHCCRFVVKQGSLSALVLQPQLVHVPRMSKDLTPSASSAMMKASRHTKRRATLHAPWPAAKPLPRSGFPFRDAAANPKLGGIPRGGARVLGPPPSWGGSPFNT